MAEQKRPLKLWVALTLAFAAFIAAGLLNEFVAMKYFGALGGTVVDIILIGVWVELWRQTRKPKITSSQESNTED